MRKVSTLSGGQQRRLDIALGLIHAPGLLFLDEPSTGMDPQNRANLWEHILRLRAEHGTTIVLTTHYLEEADAMAERVVVIDHGRIIADDTAAALKAKQAGDRLTVACAGAGRRARAARRRVGTELRRAAGRGRRRADVPGRRRAPRAARRCWRALRERGRRSSRRRPQRRPWTTCSSTSPAAACAKERA